MIHPIATLGEARHPSPLSRVVSDDGLVPEQIIRGLPVSPQESGFELAVVGIPKTEDNDVRSCHARLAIPIVTRYFDPSYYVRSGPANSEDSIHCDLRARNAVHAAMAGKTGLRIGFLHDEFNHVLIELLAGRKKSIDSGRPIWSGTLAATGQPALFQ
jgi:6-phosphofructokinase